MEKDVIKKNNSRMNEKKSVLNTKETIFDKKSGYWRL